MRHLKRIMILLTLVFSTLSSNAQQQLSSQDSCTLFREFYHTAKEKSSMEWHFFWWYWFHRRKKITRGGSGPSETTSTRIQKKPINPPNDPDEDTATEIAEIENPDSVEVPTSTSTQTVISAPIPQQRTLVPSKKALPSLPSQVVPVKKDCTEIDTIQLSPARSRFKKTYFRKKFEASTEIPDLLAEKIFRLNPSVFRVDIDEGMGRLIIHGCHKRLDIWEEIAQYLIIKGTRG